MSLSLVCIHRHTNKTKKNILFIYCEFVYVVYPQTNKQIKYLILINLICEFVCGYCGHTKKKERKKENKHTDQSLELLRN